MVLVVAVDPIDAVDTFLFGVPADLLDKTKPVGGMGPVAEIAELKDRVAVMTARELAQCADPAPVAVHIAGEQQSTVRVLIHRPTVESATDRAAEVSAPSMVCLPSTARTQSQPGRYAILARWTWVDWNSVLHATRGR